MPEKTAGPYPGDSSNGPNVLNQTGVVRSGIRSSFAGLSGTVTGVPLTIRMTLVSASTCAPLAGYAIYLWVYETLTAATAVKNKIATSQIAMPLASNKLVYAMSNYTSSARNQAQITLATDNVFSDGASLELATISGDVTNGMVASLTVAV